MTRSSIIPPLVLLLGLSGCASLPRLSHWVTIKPVHSDESREMARSEGYYAGVVAAIERRDYAQALNLLQVARTRAPNDVRVLNAFGVVYDKLGRFDLSARYYAQARALDAGSPILAANIAYSAILQRRAEAPSLPEPATAAPVRTAAVAPLSVPSIRLGFGPAASPQTLALLPGHTLAIINASGRSDGAEPTRLRLAQLGWSAPRAVVHEAQPQARTTIVYTGRHVLQAQALARTLPRGIQLVSCDDGCAGIHLRLGADALGWSLSAARRASGD